MAARRTSFRCRSSMARPRVARRSTTDRVARAGIASARGRAPAALSATITTPTSVIGGQFPRLAFSPVSDAARCGDVSAAPGSDGRDHRHRRGHPRLHASAAAMFLLASRRRHAYHWALHRERLRTPVTSISRAATPAAVIIAMGAPRSRAPLTTAQMHSQQRRRRSSPAGTSSGLACG